MDPRTMWRMPLSVIMSETTAAFQRASIYKLAPGLVLPKGRQISIYSLGPICYRTLGGAGTQVGAGKALACFACTKRA